VTVNKTEVIDMLDHRLNSAWLALRITFGAVPIVAGLDKFTNLLTDWEKYLSPLIANLLPFSPTTFMLIVGIIEIVAGVVVLTRWTRLGAYVVAAWLVSIAVNLLLAGYFDIAVRDLVMAVGAFALAKLQEVREQQGVAAPQPRMRAAHV
jgi:uncharacterized membrane protein YphA (DoxX/SURF4 family)